MNENVKYDLDHLNSPVLHHVISLMHINYKCLVMFRNFGDKHYVYLIEKRW